MIPLALGSGELRSAPLASTVPSRARIAALRGRLVRRVRRSPSRSPGNASSGRQSTRAESPSPLKGSTTGACSFPHTRVDTFTGSETLLPLLSPGLPAASPTTVAVAASSR